jgi:hypothetical protein
MLFRRCYLALLLLWPPVHLALSRAGYFSPWRFGGWGMYATPYPTPAQHPIAVLLDLREPPARREPLRRVQIIDAGADVTDWLDRFAGLSFHARGGQLARLDLGAGSASVLAETCQAVRQLERASHLLELGRFVEARLAQQATPQHQLYLSIGTRRADALGGRYGIDREVFACCARLEPRTAVAFSR